MFGIHHTLDAVLDASEPQIVCFGARSGNGAHGIGLIADGGGGGGAIITHVLKSSTQARHELYVQYRHFMNQ